MLIETDRYTPTSVLFRELRWMSLPDYYTFRKLILVFKILYNLTPNYINVFKYVHQGNTRSTRLSTSNSLYVPRACTFVFSIRRSRWFRHNAQSRDDIKRKLSIIKKETCIEDIWIHLIKNNQWICIFFCHAYKPTVSQNGVILSHISYCKCITFGDVFFLAPLAVVSICQIKYIAKCASISV